MGGLSIWHWLVVLLVIVLLFGTKKLRNIGPDLGAAIKGFRKGLRDEDDKPASQIGREGEAEGAAQQQREPARDKSE